MALLSERQKLAPIADKSRPGADGAIPAPARSLTARTAVVFLTVTALLTLLYVLWLARAVVLLIFAGVLVGLVLTTICAWIESRTRLKRRFSLPLLMLTLAGAMSLGIWLSGPAIENQIDQLHDTLPQAARTLTTQITSQHWGSWLMAHGFGPEHLPRAMDVLPRVTGILSSTLGMLAGLAIVFFLGVVIAAEPQTYRRGFERLFPVSAGAYVRYVMDEIAHALRCWLLARLLSMCAVGLMVFLGLWLLKVPMPGFLGLLAAVLAFIPNIGPVLSAVPPVLLAFSVSPRQALFVILLFCAVHMAEGFLVTPLAERTAVHLPPALTLSVQLLLAVLVGPMGIAVAAPLTTVGMVLLSTVYRQKVLGEQAGEGLSTSRASA